MPKTLRAVQRRQQQVQRGLQLHGRQALGGALQQPGYEHAWGAAAPLRLQQLGSLQRLFARQLRTGGSSRSSVACSFMAGRPSALLSSSLAMDARSTECEKVSAMTMTPPGTHRKIISGRQGHCLHSPLWHIVACMHASVATPPWGSIHADLLSYQVQHEVQEGLHHDLDIAWHAYDSQSIMAPQ